MNLPRNSGLLTPVALTLLVGVTAWLRLYNADLAILSHDEAFSWRITQYSVGGLIEHTCNDTHPPLYYLVLKFWEGLWGTSPVALRALSGLFACGTALVFYALISHALENGPASAGLSAGGTRMAAVFGAGLCALSPVLVPQSSTARMYSLGLLLAAVSAWLLLRAIRSNRLGSWIWYGLAAAAFCYTHYYAFFTLCAQGLYFFIDLRTRKQEDAREVWHRLCGFGLAALLILVLFSPWLAVFRQQVREVRKGYWIADLDVQTVRETFFSWATGVAYDGPLAELLAAGLLAAGFAFILWRAKKAAYFFLLQALMPWALCIIWSLATGRTIFLARCLVFAHLSLLGCWAILWQALPGWPERLAVGALVATTMVTGLIEHLEQVPGQSPAIQRAAEALQRAAKEGDTVLTANPGEVNRFRYYLSMAGPKGLRVSCPLGPLSRQGRRIFLSAALVAEDYFDEINDPTAELWLARFEDGGGHQMYLPFEPSFLEGLQFIETQSFSGGDGSFSVSYCKRSVRPGGSGR